MYVSLSRLTRVPDEQASCTNSLMLWIALKPTPKPDWRPSQAESLTYNVDWRNGQTLH
jgi:hypothetical protein